MLATLYNLARNESGNGYLFSLAACPVLLLLLYFVCADLDIVRVVFMT